MEISCVIGDNFNDITSRQISLIGAGVEKGRKQLVIVPDRYSLTMENRILDELNMTATFDIEVVSFARLGSKMLSHIQAPQVLSSLGATMVIEKILTEHASELKCFGNTAKTIAFASVLFDSIAQLKSCKITPTDLKNNVDRVRSHALSLKLNDIALIYEYYEKFLSTDYIDSNNRLALVSEIIGGSEDFENIDVHFCNFDSMTERGFDILRMLIRKAHSVSVGLLAPVPEQRNANIYIPDMQTSVLALANKLGVTPHFYKADNSMPAFSRHILHNAMAVDGEVVELENNKQIRLLNTTGVNSEVEFIALDIMRKIRTGVRFREIEINCTDLEKYAPVFTRIFDKYAIPYWIDLPFQLTDSEGTKFLLIALDCVLDNFQTKDVLRYARNVFSGLSIQDYATFENVVTRYGVVGERFFVDDKPAHDDEEFDRYLEIKSFLNPLKNFGRNIKGSHTIGEMVSAVRAFWEETEIKANLEGLAANFEEKGNLLKQSIARQNFDKMDAVLTQMLDILGSFETDFNQFNKILRAGLSTITISPLPMSVDCVYIGQSLTSVFNTAPYYYIVGAIDGSFPAFVADVGLIADYDIAELGQNAVQITPSIRQVNARSRASVLQSLALATEQLTITYPVRMGDEDCTPASVVGNISGLFTYQGKNIPVLFLGELLEDDTAFGGLEYRLGFLWNNDNTMLAGLVAETQNPNSAVNGSMLASCREYLKDKGYAPVLAELDEIMLGKKEVTTPKDTAALFFTKYKARVTQIEKFFECPYAHFLTYGLRLKQRRTDRPEAVDIGNILHAVFEQFGKILRTRGVLSEPEIQRVVPHIFDEVITRKDFSHIVFSGHNETMLSTLKDEAVRACKAINYQLSHSEYKIKFIETAFGSDGFASIPEVAVINTSKKIKISGKIDRADLWGNRLRIVDYKTSRQSGKFSLLNFYLGKKIQLFYYMQAILADLNLQAGGAYYLPVHREYDDEGKATKYSSYRMEGVSVYTEANMFAQDGQVSFDNPASDIVPFKISASKANKEAGNIVLGSIKNSSASEEQFGNLLKYARAVLEGAINDIYNGEIRPLYLKGACDYCPYASICRKDVLSSASERRSDFDVNLDSFEIGEENVQ